MLQNYPDNHDIDDIYMYETVVMSTEAARAGPRHATFAEAGGNILGSRNLPDFTAGTDLILPVSTNRDLRDKLALRESKSADWRIHFHAMDHDCFASEVHVPQVRQSANRAFSVPTGRLVLPARSEEWTTRV